LEKSSSFNSLIVNDICYFVIKIVYFYVDKMFF
jgi:hypothetical protein